MSGDTEQQRGLPSRYVSPRHHIVVMSLTFLTGFLGLHRFYVGRHWTGLLMLFTGGGFFLWWIVDSFAVLSGTFRDAEGRFIRRRDSIPCGEKQLPDDSRGTNGGL